MLDLFRIRVALAASVICAVLAVGGTSATAKSPAASKHPTTSRKHHTTHHHKTRRNRQSKAGAKNLPIVPGSQYLALGDSVAFGYVESQVVPAPDYTKIS